MQNRDKTMEWGGAINGWGNIGYSRNNVLGNMDCFCCTLYNDCIHWSIDLSCTEIPGVLWMLVGIQCRYVVLWKTVIAVFLLHPVQWILLHLEESGRLCECRIQWVLLLFISSEMTSKPVICPSVPYVQCQYIQNPKTPRLLGRCRWNFAHIFYG